MTDTYEQTRRYKLQRLASFQLSAALLEQGYEPATYDQIAALLDTRDVSNAGQAHCFAMLDDIEARLGVDVSKVRATVELLHGISAEDSYYVHQRG